ncbi:MAG: histidine--tRNA ligase [Desulfarculus sp.]|nr:histidine--tRNA ligase [Desulfarculus sp.]
MTIQAVRGMKDLLPSDAGKWRFIEVTARAVFGAFGFQEIRVPILERTELFARSIGAATDIVEKEMYTFSDRSGDSLTLRPEATAGILRAYIENKLHAIPGPHKLCTLGPMFRHERPQKGRLRQFHQLDVEVLDDQGPQSDAELMVMLTHLLTRLGLQKISLKLNSLGCPNCRPAFRQALTSFLAGKEQQLCEDCQRRLSTNPLRVLDCKAAGCQEAAIGAPSMSDHLCEDCRTHFAEVRRLLDLAGVAYALDPRLVRGLDYYVRTTFEAVTGDLGAQNAVAGGGRYDGLLAELGGPAQACIGFGAGIERLALLIPEEPEAPRPDIFIAATGPKPRLMAFLMTQKLRRDGYWAEMTTDDKSLKAQLRKANKERARLVLFLGDRELQEDKGQIKRMDDSHQVEFEMGGLGHLFMNFDQAQADAEMQDRLWDAFFHSLMPLIRS